MPLPPHYATTFSQALTAFIGELQDDRPGKEFSLHIEEENLYWCIKWKSQKFLDEYFQLQIWPMDAVYHVMGERRAIDLMDEYGEEYFYREDLTVEALVNLQEELILDFKKGVLEAVDTPLDVNN
ncbi:MAG: hypothetical protein CL868_05625 [Cytophagaceae bacterium]|nr:hypothetical protein [Cytophagaceae bacterium]|tara:strand:- start:13198 stop:13572 length:375 start_codon:yes stop_codon:yes gene_type:complete